MKKIYLLALSFMLVNVSAFSATGQQSKKTSSETALNQNNGDQQSHGSKTANLNVLRTSGSQPSQSSFVGCIYTDNFDGANDTSSLQARGYKTYYRGGGPAGTTATWYQGSTQVFNAFNGPVDGYVASNFNSVTATNNVDNWLVLPALNLTAGDIMSFYSQSPNGSINPDSLHVLYSEVGDSTPEDTTWVLLGEFQVNSLGFWELQTFPIPTTSANGRLAIRYAVVDGGPTGANSDYIGIDALSITPFSAVDGKTSAITSPATGCGLTATEIVSVDIKNVGSGSISGFNVSYSVDGGTPVVETFGGSISAGNTFNYIFTAPADLSTLGSHTIVTMVGITGDNNQCNDTTTISITNSTASADPLTTPYSMGFEPSEDFSSWVIEDGNGDGTTWELTAAVPHGGLNAMVKFGSGSDDNDWIYTSCMDLTGGSTYTIDYWYKNFELVQPCSFEVSVGNAPAQAAMTQSIIQHTPSDTVYLHGIATFSVATSGVYYIGFHAHSAFGTGSSSVRLDDIYVDDGTSIGITEHNANHNVSIYPNPNNGMFYVNNHIASKNTMVDVYNISGQKVLSANFDNLNQKIIDLSNQANGIYYVKITSDSFVENHAVVVNR